MSPASHMVGRLRRLHGLVLGKVRMLNGRRMPSRRDRAEAPAPSTMESLEPRVLLSGDTASLSSLYDVEASSISPAWFGSLVQTYGPIQQGASAVLAQAQTEALSQSSSVSISASWAADPQKERWIVQLTTDAIAGFSGVADTVSLFSSAPFGAQVVRGLGLAGQILIETQGASADAVSAWLKTDSSVAYAALDRVVSLQDTTPDDPSYPLLWGLNNTGQSGGTADADIDAPQAWDVSTGNSSVVVGVIDTGVDYTHPDLAANIWTNPGEIAGNGIDDDGNGFIDDIHGYDFVNNDGDPMDDHYHGTHVSGTIAGVGNNGVGVVGVNWSAQIMGLKFLDSGGSGYDSDAIRAVNYATMMHNMYVPGVSGANINLTSNSWGGGGFDQGLQDAIGAAGTAGMLFIAAAGNGGADGIGDNNDATPSYPASYPLDNIIAVAATDRDDARASFSNYGATSVDLGAPGVDIYSTKPGNTYGYLSGTSMATPHVSGVAALAWSMAPAASYQTIRDAILNGVDPVSSMAGITVTGGRLNALGTLMQLNLAVVSSTPAHGSVVTAPIADVVVNFSQPYLAASVDADDLTVNGIAADTFTLTDADTVTFHFAASPVSAEGLQTMNIAAGAILRASDSGPISAWNASFRYDATVMAVTSTDPIDGSIVTLPLAWVDINFNEAVGAASIDMGDLSLSQGAVTGAALTGPSTVRYTLSGVTAEGTLTINLAAGALTDTYGNPGAAYTGNFSLDVGMVPFPTPLTPVNPLGSLVYSGSASGIISPGSDTDSFTISLDAGQTITVLAHPAAGLQPTVTLQGPGGTVLAAATAPAAGQDAVVTAPVSAAGLYTLTISSAGGTTGAYTVGVILNASLEAESHDGSANDTRATAQDIDGTFTSLGGASSRGAVLGTSDVLAGILPAEIEPNNSVALANSAAANFAAYSGSLYHIGIKGSILPAGNNDWFNLGLMDVGDVITISESASASLRGALSDCYLYLYRYNGGSPTLVASNDDGGPGLDSLIYRYSVTAADVYYVMAGAYSSSYSGTYDLGVWLENAGAAPTTGGALTSETEPNDSAAAANDASTSWRAVQYQSQTSAAITSGDVDYYSFQFTAGDLVSANIAAGGTLDARSWLLNSSGTAIALEDGTSSGPGVNSPIYAYQIPTTGTYYLEVAAYSGTGTYNANVYLSTNTPPPAPSSGAQDYYSFSLTAGDVVTLGLTGLAGGTIHLSIEDAGGTSLATGASGPTNLTEVISNFAATATGTYYARVTGLAAAPYSLVVTRNAAFGAKPSDSLTAIDLVGSSKTALGYVGGLAGSALYVINWEDGAVFQIDPSSGAILNTLPAPSTFIATNPYGLNLAAAPNIMEYNAGQYFGDTTVAQLNMSTGALLGSWVGAGSPSYYSIAYLDGSIYACDGTGIRVMDAATGALIRTLSVPGGVTLEGMAGDAETGHLFANAQATHSLYEIDPLTGAVLRSASNAYVGNEQDLGLAGNEIYVSQTLGPGAGNWIQVYDKTTFALERTITVSVPSSSMVAGVAAAQTAATPDWYEFTVNAGDSLIIRTATPGDGAGEFVNNLDPEIELYDPSGTLVGSDANSAPDGRNALLSYTALVAGTYKVRVLAAASSGEYVLNVAGATGDMPAFFVTSTDPVDGAILPAAPTTMSVSFSHSILLTSVDASDLTVDGVGATAVTVVDGNTILFTVPGGFGQGPHTVAIAAGAVQDISGAPVDAYAGLFTVDGIAPWVIFSSIQEDDTLTGGLTYTVTFSEPMRSTNLDATDFSVHGTYAAANCAPASFIYDPTGTTLTLNYGSLPDDQYTLTLLSGNGRFEDLVGNDLDGEALSWPIPPNTSGDGTAGGDFVVDFYVDNGTAAFPTPLTSLDPAGSLIYGGSTATSIVSATDTDSFTISLDAGQTITVLMHPTGAALQPTVQLLGPGGTVLGTASSAAGQDAFLQTLPVATAGTYTIVAASAGGTAGAYALQATLNAALDVANHGGPSNDTPAAAQDIDGSFIGLGGSASRGAVVGVGDPVGTGWLADFTSGADGFTIDNTGGGLWHLSIGHATESGHSALQSMYYGQGEGPAGGGNYNTGASNTGTLTSPWFTPDAASTVTFNYILRTENSTSWDYSYLQISTGSSWTTLASYNGVAETSTWTAAAPVSLAAYAGQNVQLRWFFDTLDSSVNDYEGWYVDDIQVGIATPFQDYYSFTLQSGETATLGMQADGTAHVTLEDAGGTVLASGATGAANLTEVISNFTASTTGTYYAHITGTSADPYSLVVTRGASFDTESNDSLGTAQPIPVLSGPGQATVLGSVGGLALAGQTIGLGELSPGTLDNVSFTSVSGTGGDDYYAVTVAAGDSMTMRTATPGDGAGEFVNNLDPEIELYDPSGTLVGSDDNGGGGRNALLNYVALAGGTYTVRVLSADGSAGEYVLTAAVTSLSAPTLDAEPAYTPGDSNTIQWSAVAGADAYYAEYDDDPAFGSPDGNSGWIAQTSYTFTGLPLDIPLYYRVKAGHTIPGSSGSWTQTSQADFQADALANASATLSPGDVTLAEAGTVFFQDGFEDGDYDGWVVGLGSYARQVTDLTAAAGAYSFTQIGGSGGHYDGVSHPLGGIAPDHVHFYVRSASASAADGYFVIGAGSTSLTGAAAFFYMNGAGSMGIYDGASWHGTPYVANQWYAVDLALNWQAKTVDYYVDNQLISGNIAFRDATITSLANVFLYNYSSSQAWYDDISFSSGVGGSGYAPSGSVVSTPIVRTGSSQWGTLTFDTTTPTGTTLTVDVLNAAGALLAANVASGTNLAALGIAPTAIKLRGDLATTDALVTPSLQDWTVTWDAVSLRVESDWSNVESSTQSSSVVGRYVFYNNSYFDGNNPAANAADDNAIAPAPGVFDPAEPTKDLGKSALLPGQTASFVNYTSYGRGINGIMVDVAGLANPAGIDATDFVFKVGNSNDPSAWALAPAPLSVTVRLGEGAGGSDRITIIWADDDPMTTAREAGAISGQWLQVTVLADADTGLAGSDVFYFGNAIGETGDSPTSARVDPTDQLGVRNNPHTLLKPAAIFDAYDMNRDRKVDPTDQLIARYHPTTFLNMLKLIAAPVGPAMVIGDEGGKVLPASSAGIGAGAGNAGGNALPGKVASADVGMPAAPAWAPVVVASGAVPLSLAGGAGQAVSLVLSGLPTKQALVAGAGLELDGLLVNALAHAGLALPL